MVIESGCDVRNVAGCSYRAHGETDLSGAPLALFRRIDGMLLRWAARWNAEDHSVPSFLSAETLARVGYLRSFPHLATFPVALDPCEEGLRSFAHGDAGAAGEVRLPATAPVREVLTPAACYHLYPLLEDRALEGPVFWTTNARCYRREAWYRPLERQWCFSMREIVCVGSETEVQAFLDAFRNRLERLFDELDLGVGFEAATDPFFEPERSPGYVMQKAAVLKTEMVFGSAERHGDGLAIGSLNSHRDHFGRVFKITRDGETASSGCVAFGLERWLYAFLQRFGAEGPWPELERMKFDDA